MLVKNWLLILNLFNKINYVLQLNWLRCSCLIYFAHGYRAPDSQSTTPLLQARTIYLTLSYGTCLRVFSMCTDIDSSIIHNLSSLLAREISDTDFSFLFKMLSWSTKFQIDKKTRKTKLIRLYRLRKSCIFLTFLCSAKAKT